MTYLLLEVTWADILLHHLGARGEPLPTLLLPWDRFPKELRPGVQGKRPKVTVKPKMVKRGKIDIGRLEELAQKEKGEEKGSDEEKEQDSQEGEEEEEKKEEAEEEEDEPDEEMDGGTDYANQYFESGDNYLDEEEDNLDEGGIF